jgi:hypothetical protein
MQNINNRGKLTKRSEGHIWPRPMGKHDPMSGRFDRRTESLDSYSPATKRRNRARLIALVGVFAVSVTVGVTTEFRHHITDPADHNPSAGTLKSSIGSADLVLQDHERLVVRPPAVPGVDRSGRQT